MQRSLAQKFSFLTSICCLFVFTQCRIAKNLPTGQTLLVKNKIILQTGAKTAIKGKIREDLLKIAAQKPNVRLFGFMPARLWLYHNATNPHKKLTKFRQWLINKVGEPPVVYDSLLVGKSLIQMQSYLFNFGYFHAVVTDSVITKNKKTTISFTCNTGEPWIIGTVELPKGHTACDSLVRARHSASALHKGERLDVTNLKAERNRIETELKNAGYFTFSGDYITFDFDTFSEPNVVNIKIILNPPGENQQHQQYWMNKIYVITDYSVEGLNDTTRRDTITVGEYKLIAHKMKFRKNVILNAIFFKRGELYSKLAEIRTYNRLSQLGVFKFISFDYAPVKDHDTNYLDCIIRLAPAKKQSWGGTAELNVTDEGLFGTAGSISYVNKNLSKGADKLVVDASAGVQVRFSRPKGSKEKVQVMDLTLSAGVTYYLNKFLVPFRKKIFSPNANPKTRIGVRYDFEHRYDFDTLSNVVFLYQLHNFNASFGYEWQKNLYWHHLFNPIEVDFYLLPETGAEFIRRLDLNPILKSSFEDQIIIGPNYAFTYTNQKSPTQSKYMYFRGFLETAGNVIEGAFKLASLNDQHDSLYLIANRPFAEFFRIEADWRNFIHITRHSLFAIKTYAGIGVPYGNSVELPFIKQFYVGGPNDLRGFQVREVGPGAYVDTTVFDPKVGPKNVSIGFFNQTGDIKLETNAEIRFDIYKWLKGAIFADAGNVWTLRQDARLNGNFDITKIWRQFAVDAGAGLRLDFSYFVIRFDYGFPLRDPRRADGEWWQFANGVAFKHGQLQLGIGYPF
jgi:outer membrane protein insertion porin family